MKETILNFLRELTTIQETATDVLLRKQKMLVHPNKKDIDAIAAEEKTVMESLAAMLQQRETILTQAKEQGTAAESLKELCERLMPLSVDCVRLVELARQQSRSLQYLALANYTVSKRSLIHLNQVLEIIETRGQGRTTYGKQNGTTMKGGGFVDKVA